MISMVRAPIRIFALAALLGAACDVDPDALSTHAGDGGLPPPSTPKLAFEPIRLGIDRATDFVFVPDSSDELFVTAQRGALHRVRIADDRPNTLESVDIPHVFFDEGCGLLSIAVDPEYTRNKLIYLGRCSDTRTTTLARYRYDGLALLPATEAEILKVVAEVDPEEDWHRWGSLGFDDDGETMWALLGDLFERRSGQDIADKAGSLLRFRPNRTPGGSGHTPATDNPWTDGPGDPTVYAYGFRSPWRGARDRHGRYWVGDVGLVTKEEVDLVTAAGQNFGWDRFEGRCTDGCDDLVQPMTDWGRTSNEPYDAEDPDVEPATKRAAWVGAVYESPARDRYHGLLTDYVLYGDFYTGWVRAMRADDAGRVADDRLVGHLPNVVSVRLGPDGYLYLLTLDGRLHRAVQRL